MKAKQRFIYILIVLGVLAGMTSLATMLINVALHYLFILLHSLPSIVRSIRTNTFHPNLSFRSGYLFTTVSPLKWYYPWLFALILMMLRGRQTVLKISHRVFRSLPVTKPDFEGSSRWQTKKEIRQNEQLVAIPHSNIRSVKDAGIPIARDLLYTYACKAVVHSLIVGITRSGKGQLMVQNTIRFISQCKNPESFIVFDLRGDNAQSNYRTLKKTHKIHIINLDNPKKSAGWDLLSTIRKAFLQEIKEGDFDKTIQLTTTLAHAFTEDSTSEAVWPESCKQLLTAMILYLLDDGYKRGCLDKVNMYSVTEFFIKYAGQEIKIGRTTTNALDTLFSELPDGHLAKNFYATSKFAQGDMRSSIFAILSANLSMFNDSGIIRLTSNDDVDFADLANPDKPCAIFIIVPEGREERNKLVSLLVDQCYAELLDIARARPDGQLPRRVRIIADEICNYPKITALSNKITTSLARGIILDMYIHSLPQFEDKYGKNTAQTILSNGGNLVYIYSQDKATNQYVSDLLDTSTEEYRTYNSENGAILDNNRMSHYKGRPLKTPGELRRLKFWEIVVIQQRNYPIHSHLVPFFQLHIPVAAYEELPIPIHNEKKEEHLFPVSSIMNTKRDTSEDAAPLPGDNDAPPAAADTHGDHKVITMDTKLQGVLNNIDILTHGKFRHAAEKRNKNALYTMITKYQEAGQLNMEQAELLESYVDDLSDTKE
ncbi:VirD4-like conjugal transfer protein, CD1115 family [Ethanoligenens harbinense]|uniref:TRAG family protein n=1 Tax=Ethanoligenens harbinense (strain DSM 18485 / JCM 12961 / CGMCC 1.5033 / YUAN-3) TaxID=663278 RepID=E6U5W3_ETHHY|nr:type IV secretory system conjugative DNA transfer family protein [Ethanoligenens harbinense]ADU27980.1 TRAG family protein [Ethanoligenens harbinense YUAN-3]AVQ97006.1 hypothetical protein CXQ68_12760 [Ethanoligenens harbinense YUAN-3]AYF39667.1 hypothetical protein CXP51_12660 [Ethanoligenens harbinense]AYF42498.1 hypothetical protein CN246_13230 [Ethanoligenens harbinense]QCN93248.1 type IV secretory system conjugative DNA transfer family protein [Ethanoligenens harbinense]